MNSDNLKRESRKMAYILGIITFSGFFIFLFMPTTYKNPFGLYLIVNTIIFAPFALFVALLVGLCTYFIFKLFKNKIIRWVFLLILLVICFFVGIMLQGAILRLISSNKPYVSKIDSDYDGKIDKWVFHDELGNIIAEEIDADHDSKPDTKEYYRGGRLLRTEQIKSSSHYAK